MQGVSRIICIPYTFEVLSAMPTSKRRKKRLLTEKQRRQKVKRRHTLASPVGEDLDVSWEMASNETSSITQDHRLQVDSSGAPGWTQSMSAPIGLSQLYNACVQVRILVKE